MENKNTKTLAIICLMLSFGTATGIISLTTPVEAAPEQIIINPDNIKELKAFGETDKPEYIEFYPPSYLFDNLVNSYSFWTQQGNAGFDLELKEKLDNKKVCSLELGVFQPSNTPFTIRVNDDDSTILNGTLNNEKVSVNYNQEECISDFEKLEMNFNPSDRKVWTTIAEVKIFSEDVVVPPPVDPPAEGNVTKIIIGNSKVEMDLNDSEVTINTDGENSKVKTVEKEKGD